VLLTRVLFGVRVCRYHCELNEIEFFWSDAKRHARSHCSYTITALRVQVPKSIASVPTQNVRNYYEHVRKLEEAYRRGATDEEAFVPASVADCFVLLKSFRCLLVCVAGHQEAIERFKQNETISP
jgi:hypothetical protein